MNKLYFNSLHKKLKAISSQKRKIVAKSPRYNLLSFYRITFRKTEFQIGSNIYPYSENNKFENILSRLIRTRKKLHRKLKTNINQIQIVIIGIRKNRLNQEIKMFKTIIRKLTIYNRYIKLNKIK